jgi:hypothetical protein
MNFSILFQQLPQDFNLSVLNEEDRPEVLLEIVKTIQKQFLSDIYDIVGKEKFDALVASSAMGEEFYATTLKHLVPSYEEVFVLSRMKIVDAFHKK